MAVAAVLAGGMPASASAAGLGRLTVESGLGQPLNAVVEVTSLSRDELSSLSARLAAPDAFRRVGIEMSPALGSLRFAVEERASGNPVVRITSEQPINEPFVDLLVELNWAAGRFVREYTFLLDPPELKFGRESVEGKTVMSQLATPVVASTAAVPVSQRIAPAQGGAAGTAGEPMRTAQPASGGAPRAAAPSRRLVAQAGTSPDSVQPGFASGQAAPSEVTVQRGDTLAAIADRVKPADIAVEQAIISIYEANPRAFFGSVHQLRAGRTLSIPDRAAMEAVDANEARRQIRMQAADFNAYRERLANATRKVDVAETGASASGAITARVDETGAAPAAGDQLRLSRSGPGEAGNAGGSATGTQGGQVSAEALVASEAALREQTERVSLLEKNIADLQRLLELKNQQLAQMQLQAQLQTEAAQTGAPAAGSPAAGA
ncbi:MAG TPA: FimV/HubP family polar landmark protein, partial [Burkholderiaceae bacterium]|nr:FimV/HubP family polar landmark protein [Burkholderiaceae bacterium]